MHFTSVLLPAPFSPSSACTVPRRTVIDEATSEVKVPKRLLSFSVSSDSAPVGGGACWVMGAIMLALLLRCALERRQSGLVGSYPHASVAGSGRRGALRRSCPLSSARLRRALECPLYL